MNPDKKPRSPLAAVRDAVEMLGGQRPAARATGFSQHKLWKAVNNKMVGRKIDPALAVALHNATKGKVKKSEMRPDVFAPRNRAEA
jgi:DNA-binding transcriptional regulator YdaS (Cro superfamily)